MVERRALDEALRRASDENGLPEYYRDLVRPIVRAPRARWPTCCGSLCDPCSTTLVRVADRTLELLGVDAPIEVTE